jgi:hypothetical protein
MVMAPLWAWAQDGSEACLITRDEFAALSGWTAYTDPEPMPWGNGAVCGYDGGQILLFSGETAMENLEHVWESFGAGGNRVPVPELGAEAYAFFVEAENHVWTPPALQALSSSFRHRRVSCCHVSGLQYGHMAAGLDEIRGSAPDYQVELEALWFSRALPTHGPTVVPSR